MTKASNSKHKSSYRPVSTTRPTTAHKRPSDKSIKLSKPKTLAAAKSSKIDKIIAMMRRPNGAAMKDLIRATAWQAHSVRGAISGTLRKKQGLSVVFEKTGDVRLYRITDKADG
jgi:hypothetical protein